MTKYKIGVYGSAAGAYAEFVPLAEQVGHLLGARADSVVVITGACSGLPYIAAKTAANQGAEVWGYSFAPDEAAQRRRFPDDDLSIYTKLLYVPQEFAFADQERVGMKYRNVTSTAACDAAIILSGRWGTLNEVTNLIDLQKVTAVLTGTGGVADELPALSRKISKEGQGPLIFDRDPRQLINKLITELERRQA